MIRQRLELNDSTKVTDIKVYIIEFKLLGKLGLKLFISVKLLRRIKMSSEINFCGKPVKSEMKHLFDLQQSFQGNQFEAIPNSKQGASQVGFNQRPVDIVQS